MNADKEVIKKKLNNQLVDVRNNLHLTYTKSKTKSKQTLTDELFVNKSLNLTICGDSMTNGLDSKGVSSKLVKSTVRSFSGATSSDMVDFVKPFVDKKPDLLFLHVGTNDLTKGVHHTKSNLEEIINYIEKKSPKTELILSDVCLREDKPYLIKDRNELNAKIHQLAKERNVSVLNNNNIDSSCLSRKKLHLNRKGMARLAVNIKKKIDMFSSK